MAVPTKMGLVLGGAGARGAYQAGVLAGIAELLGRECAGQRALFPILAGASAGAINVSYLAAATEDFPARAARLAALWSGLDAGQVMRTDVFSLSRLGLAWARDLVSGGIGGRSRSTHLLDTAPLRALVEGNVSFEEIRGNIASGALHGLAISLTSYATGTSVTYFDGDPSIAAWNRSARIGIRHGIGLEHILASAAIPILFRPVRVGGSFFGDGCIRSSSPLSPAIHLGAERILAVGVRYPRGNLETLEINDQVQMDSIALADVAGVILNSLFLDALDADVERLERINETLAMLPPDAVNHHPRGLKPVHALVIRPSQDLGQLAAEQFDRFPRILRHLLRGIGASQEKGADLLSYIAFDRAYTGKLVDLGRNDALARGEEIRRFFGCA